MSIFSKIPLPKVKRSTHNLSFDNLLTTDYGRLTPILCEPIQPGERWRYKPEVFCRSYPMVAPIMHEVNIFCHFFFVPDRIIWPDSEEFYTGGSDGNSRITPPHFFGQSDYPLLAAYYEFFRVGTLYDYLDFPIMEVDGSSHSSTAWPAIDLRPFLVYRRIFDDYYRDENLTAPLDYSSVKSGVISPPTKLGEGDSYVNELFQLRQRSWKKDYFTAALPWAQRGTELFVPLDNGFAPVNWMNLSGGTPPPTYLRQGGVRITENGQTIQTASGSAGNPAVSLNQLDPGSGRDTTLWADLSNMQGFTIETLRRTAALQQFLEKSARGGGRYGETILSHYGLYPQDARLQRAEYLGGMRQPLTISEVLQTSATTEDSPLGDMGGRAVSAGSVGGFRFRAPEHGWIMGIMSVMPKAVYDNQLPRKYQLFDRLDYPWPEFQHIGEQAIMNSEVYVSPSGYTQPDYTFAKMDEELKGTFGYAPRYAEWKSKQSRIHGDFHNTLDFWTMVRRFSSRPNLNSAFVTYPKNSSPDEKCYPVYNHDKLIFQVKHKIRSNMPLSKWGIPRLI